MAEESLPILGEEYVQLPMEDDSVQQDKSCCGQKTFRERFPLSISLGSVAVICGFPCGDFTTDIAGALPALYKLQDKTTFWLQLLAIVLSTLVSAISYTSKKDFFPKLKRVFGPEAILLAVPILVAICFLFPIFPFLVIIIAVFAWANVDKETMKMCESLAPILAASEILESLLSLGLQSNIFFTSDAHGLLLSMVVSLLSAAKVATGSNFAESVYWGCTRKGNLEKDIHDEYLPIITGPLRGAFDAPLRVGLVFIHSGFEIASGLACTILFHISSRELFIIEGFRISIAAACMYLVQVFLFILILPRTAPISRAKRYESALKAPFFLPLPLLDGSFKTLPLYLVKASAQIATLISMYSSSNLVGISSDSHMNQLLYAYGASSILMWVSLVVIRCCAVLDVPAIVHLEYHVALIEGVDRPLKLDLTTDGITSHAVFRYLQDDATSRAADSDVKNAEVVWNLLRTEGQEKHEALSGIKQMKVPHGENIDKVYLPSGLQHLTFEQGFNQPMEKAALPSGLQHLAFGGGFNQPMETVALPSGLQHMEFGYDFNQPMENVALPSGLQHMEFGFQFNQPMEKVALPSSLQHLALGEKFNRPMEKVALPSGLQHLAFGWCFNQPMETVALPFGLQHLAFGFEFNQPMEKVALPFGLQRLAFGLRFNRPMEKVALPSGLQQLAFGFEFNQPMENVALPSGLQHLAFDYNFNQPMEKVALPSGLQHLVFGEKFNQPMENVALPSGLQLLAFGGEFNQPMENVALPSGLQHLAFGYNFNQPMEKVALPPGLQIHHHQ